MSKLVQVAGTDRETRRWIFDAVAWLVGVVMAVALAAEAAAGERGSGSPPNAASTSERARATTSLNATRLPM